jgi:hypothetical protein
MRNKVLFTSATVAAILAGASMASGQGMNEPSKGSQPSAGQRSTTGQSSGAQQRPDHGAPSAAQRQEKPSAGQRQEKETTGQAPAGRQSAEPKQPQHQEKGSAGKPSAAQQHKNERETTGQAPAEPRRDMQRQSPSTQGQAKPSGPRAGETTGAASSTANISTEQRTRIRETVLKQSNAPRIAKAEFNVAVGTVVPSSVHFVRLPEPIVEIYPAWRGYDYVLVGDVILILDPRDHRIVAVLDA